MADAQVRREQVLRAIEAAGGSALLAEIADLTGMHPNTVRGHLDVLVAAGTVEAQTEPASGRGRPAHRYRVVAATPPFVALAQALGEELDTIDADAARRAAQRWSVLVAPPAPARTPDEAVEEVALALGDLGFKTDVSPVGDAIVLRGCPYANIADDAPAICDIHAALVSQLLAHTGQDVELESMEVWSMPEACVARLRRTDRRPARVVTVDADGHVERSA